MQTFLPYPDFDASAAVLDAPRLGKQRVECLQVLRALELPEYGWTNHPVVTMWRGRTEALVVYSLACVRAWRALGHADTTAALISEFAPEVAGATQAELAAAGALPTWVGRPDVHLSHRSALVRKDPEHYRPLFEPDVPDDLPYTWPGADDVPARSAPVGRPLWVARPPDNTVLGVMVSAGAVGVGLDSGVDVAADTEPEAGGGLRGLLAERAEQTGERRRPGKALRQLEALVSQVAVGDEVAVAVQGEQALLLGRVTGDYAFAGARDLLPHRRPVRWVDVVPRAAVERPAVLQDPRALYRVTLGLHADPAA